MKNSIIVNYNKPFKLLKMFIYIYIYLKIMNAFKINFDLKLISRDAFKNSLGLENIFERSLN